MTTTHSATVSPATERLARAALTLHRLALAAAEVQHLPSPATPVERNAKGVSDPTPSAAMDPRREAVRDAFNLIAGYSAGEVADQVEDLANTLAMALDQWDGKRP